VEVERLRREQEAAKKQRRDQEAAVASRLVAEKKREEAERREQAVLPSNDGNKASLDIAKEGGQSNFVGTREPNHAVNLSAKDVALVKRMLDKGVFGANLNPDERWAVTVLTRNEVDFERSLESVRELPESLSEKPAETKAYFHMFTSAFERTYVAAQALSTGAVKVQLDMKDDVLGRLLGAIGWVAEQSNIPFLGCISIFAVVVKYQRETRKKNLLWVFQEFFRGRSRDQYLFTYRSLAEQICLGMDFPEYSKDLCKVSAARQNR